MQVYIYGDKCKFPHRDATPEPTGKADKDGKMTDKKTEKAAPALIVGHARIAARREGPSRQERRHARREASSDRDGRQDGQRQSTYAGETRKDGKGQGKWLLYGETRVTRTSNVEITRGCQRDRTATTQQQLRTQLPQGSLWTLAVGAASSPRRLRASLDTHVWNQRRRAACSS